MTTLTDYLAIFAACCLGPLLPAVTAGVISIVLMRMLPDGFDNDEQAC